MDGKEKIVIVGYGWVGQANAVALAKMGYPVWFFDTAETPTLHYSEEDGDYKGISRAHSIKEVDSPNTWFIVCVGDRVSEEREQDISLIKKATDSLKGIQGHVILRSTVLPQKLKELTFDMYMPEFLHEMNAVDECFNPFYFVLGTRDEIPMPAFVKDWERRSHKVFKGTPEEASYVKYLSNIWNSVRIAFVNEMGDSMGTPETKDDVKKIERVLDFVLERKSYLRYGQGFDGHCLPKDTRAYIGAHQNDGKNVDLLVGAYASNEAHKKIQERYQSLPKVFSFWEYDQSQFTILGFAWHKLNQIPFIKSARKDSRFIVDAIARVLPDRSTEKVIEIWEEKARENPHYYSYGRTKSGKEVTDAELRETGKRDYERYIQDDEELGSILARESKKRALDFGSGVGRVTEFLADDFDEVHGIDISPTMLEHARTRVSEDRVVFDTFDGYTLPYGSKYFDFVFSYLTLQHVPTVLDVERYLREIHNVLKDGGIAKVQVRGGRGVKKWEWSYGVSFTPEEAITLAEKVGFTVRKHHVEGVKNVWLVLQK